MLCEHAPATLEAKTNVRLGVSSHSVLTAVLGRQYGYTPLYLVASSHHASVVVWITERLPYQVLEQDNAGEGERIASCWVRQEVWLSVFP